MSIVNFKELEKYIVEFEKIMDKGELNLTEKKLVLQELIGRLNKQIQNLKASDMISTMPLGNLMNRIMKGKDKPES